MVGMRSDRARARARNLLATIYPLPDDPELHRLPLGIPAGVSGNGGWERASSPL